MPVPEPIDRLGPLALRCPDPAVEVLHPDFLKLRLFSASVERLAGGLRRRSGRRRAGAAARPARPPSDRRCRSRGR